MNVIKGLATASALLLLLGGCDDQSNAKEGAEPSAPPSSAKPETGADAAQSAAAKQGTETATPKTATAKEKYPLDAIKPIVDHCSKPWVILASRRMDTESKKAKVFGWARQVMAANPQFDVVYMKAPSRQGQVRFSHYGNVERKATTLVADCFDGWTCNRIAAAYKHVVKTSRPQLGCGPRPKSLGLSQPGVIGVEGKGSWLPDRKDGRQICARLAACMFHENPATEGDPGMECQRAPSKFKTNCAQKPNCAEVIRCMND